jgi:hypothetical protein
LSKPLCINTIEKKDNIKRKPIFVETIFVKLVFMN